MKLFLSVAVSVNSIKVCLSNNFLLYFWKVILYVRINITNNN